MRHLRPFLAGIVGVLLSLSAWHLWQDHLAHHAMLSYLQQKPREATK